MRKIFRAVLLLTSLALTLAAADQQVLINAAGATFPFPMYSKWFDQYHKMHPEIQINYQSIGSGGGIKSVTEGTVDFGASDGPMTDEQMKQFAEKRKTSILHFPTVLGAAVACYNVQGVKTDLNFTPEALAGIFLGKITKWNDSEIEKANPNVKLPASDIVVVHRSDGSGTTYVWSDFLSKVSDEWKSKVGRNTSLNWPVGLGGKGNEGVTGQIQQTPNSIGYVELIYAIQNKLSYGRVRNSSGSFVKADLESVNAAAASVASQMPDDFRVSITNPGGKTAYPIATFTWLLIPEKISDPAKKKAIVEFLHWMLGEGQDMTEALDYARLPKPVIAKELKAISKIQ
ncbi:MAG: phosphate ABC transporter substrate-binding protein PstS [Acidobacteriota bacterium]|nr:phosphate ABC transporter substrate-binding protein PstS [Acidobacteriota bacterium]